jgi:hypothetical protein
MRRIFVTAPLVLMCVLAASACGSNSPGTGALGAGATTPGAPSATPNATTPAAVVTTTKPVKTTTSPPSWPVPEDCVSYDPGAVTVNYEAGVYQVEQGTKVVARASGSFAGEDVGPEALALAQNYSKHCYIGRTNNRANPNDFIFDYWRDPSGRNVTIPGEDNNCSPYNRNNLTVEDMGNGDGWRVKDHDHVLALFDNGDDARNGKLVLSKYNQICNIGDSDDNAQILTYMKG